ncbi:MAG: hypothetical protein CMG74_12055, partial [Candidatus Marinimicrobia bacterium]|nr:hypothetical protein [Candidatus Neomarinimicrobiota bacterium]
MSLSFHRSVFIFLFFVPALFSESDERGNPNYRRITPIDVNRVRVSIQNYGSSGNDLSGPQAFFYEWPTNSGRGYIAYQALYVGAEVVTDDGIHKPIVTITHRSDQEGNSMAWEPIPGYLNPNSSKIAISDDISTWPTTWPDKMDDSN